MFQPLDFSHERDLSIDELIHRMKAYFPDGDFDLLKRAYEFAKKAHSGQKRSSGEDYIIHPVNVASTLIKLRMDMASVAAGFLHDVVEDCEVTPEDIEENFGAEIKTIVVGLTKISKIKFKTKEEAQIENFRKMVVAMAKDLRVIIVKLADRMHNMRTLQYVSDLKQKQIAQETLDIYVPLASRLGINSVKGELEDLCLRFLKSEIYYRLAEKVAMKKSDRDDYIRETISLIKEKIGEYGVKAEVKGRPKHFYSIYKKMVARDMDFDQIQDILAFRIVSSNISECYKILGIIHSSFTPIPGRFKDYIAIPKVNNYQSLHTTVIGPKAERIEIQIRTSEMDEIAETGVAAHWKYKEGLNTGEIKLDWVQELLEFNQSEASNSDFLAHVKNDLDVGGIFVFTPTGDVRELNSKATPLDFAYSVHTEVGHKCVGAKVNGKMVPLRYRLKSGDTVEILTSKSQSPSKDWLNIAKTSRAKSKIKQWLLKIERDKNKEEGKALLEKAFRCYDTSLKTVLKKKELKTFLDKYSYRNEDEIYIHVGSGKFTAAEVIDTIERLHDNESEDQKREVQKLKSSYSTKLKTRVKKKSQSQDAVIVGGMDSVLVRLAKCCNPIPGDPIVGYITRGRGISVHTLSCSRVSNSELGRTVDVQWNENFNFSHPVSIRVVTLDKPGILSVISKNINNLDVNIKSAIARSLPDRKGSFIFEVEIKDYSDLIKVINTIEALEEVISVNRV